MEDIMTPEQAKILGQIEQKLNDICHSNAREHKEIKEQIQKNLDIMEDRFLNYGDRNQTQRIECQRMFDERPTNTLFYWVVGGVGGLILVGFITLTGLIMDARDKIDRHIYYSAYVYNQVTGQAWDDATKKSFDKAREGYEKYIKDRKKINGSTKN